MNHSKHHTVTVGKLGTLIVIALSLVLSACAGKRKAEQNDDRPVVDMTRPPELVRDISEQRVESNPEETISFEEWRKERDAKDAEAAAEDAAAGEGADADPESN
ncbi:MAG: hypothetical protein AAF431_19945 [Pseudomonadota bacterium]